MPRKTDDDLASAVTALSVLDGRAELREVRLRLQEGILRKLKRRVMPKVFTAMGEILENPGSKEDGPKVNLILGLLNKYASDLREPANQNVNVGRGAKNVQFNIVGDGKDIMRGTPEARERALLVKAERRELVDGTPADDQR